MVFHVADNSVFAFDFAVPVLDGSVDVCIRERAQQLMELGIGLVDNFTMKALAELRGMGIEVEQFLIARRQNSAADSRTAFDYGAFMVAVTAGVPVSGILGDSLQHDRLIFLMQLPESRLCLRCLMVSSFRLRLFLGKRKSRGRFHTLCFVNFLDLFRFGEEQV